jgi:hypothetical protein
MRFGIQRLSEVRLSKEKRGQRKTAMLDGWHETKKQRLEPGSVSHCADTDDVILLRIESGA